MHPLKYKPKKNTGLLKHRVTFLKPPGEIVGGWPTTEWTEYVTVWAGIETQKGRRVFEAAAVQMQDLKKISIRYRADLNDSMRIRHKGQDYDIFSMSNDDENNEWYTILAREVL
ncbi:phage head closure protein [Bacillus sp. B-jedd]|uniref:phage head closure protein n=1 Tax=Bacillus sp. B-jedd TaxID=1476857 RepID=UPI0005156EB6|nr:phage head closure protein [Bacillus sp. B-jedd]CEG28082.1 phage-like protein [Bacillus sp. B-jedd]